MLILNDADSGPIVQEVTSFSSTTIVKNLQTYDIREVSEIERKMDGGDGECPLILNSMRRCSTLIERLPRHLGTVVFSWWERRELALEVGDKVW